MVFQSYALYPHLTVFDNIAFGLRLRKVPKDEIDRRVNEVARILGLEEFLDRKPRALSGGQRQRVAMGRAIVRQPQAYLMDEPLSNLDAKLRVHMRAEISSLQDELGVTTIYVTHDQVEAMTMGDRVAVMRKGELQQVAPPQELYERPVNLFVGGFIGSPAMNMVEATIERRNGGARRPHRDGTSSRSRSRSSPNARRSSTTWASASSSGVRPENLEDAALEPDTPADQRLQGVVVLREPLGSEIVAHIEIDAPPALTEDVRELARDVGQERAVQAAAEEGAQQTTLVGRFGPRSRIKSGERVDVAVETGRAPLLRSRDRARHLLERNDTTGTGIATRGRSRAMRYRWLAFALVVGAFAFVAAGCGGDDDGGGGAEGSEDVSGDISIMAIWGGDEQESFQAVIDGFNELYPNVNVTYTSGGDNLAPLLSTAVEGGNPPDIAAVGQPGLMAGFVEQGALQPLDDLRQSIVDNFGESVADVGAVDGTQYGVMFKGANKSTVWYNVADFEEAGVGAPETFDELVEGAETLKAAGVTPYSVGVDVGWPMTDLFENIYIRTAGPEMYDQLATHEIPWTDQSVKDALTIMADVVGDSANMAGGTEGALQTDMPDSVAKVFTDSPEAAMVIIGDFAPGVVETTLEPESGYNVFTFPSVEDSGPSVVGGGDLFVNFKNSPAADAFLEYLTTPMPPRSGRRAAGSRRRTRTSTRACTPTRSRRRRPARSQRRRSSASTCPTCSRRRSAARPDRGCSRRSPTSSRTRTTSTGSRSRWRRTPEGVRLGARGSS